MTVLDVAVVGGGQAGLGIGYCLQQAGHTFVILERGRVGETWRSQRWDSFAVNTPNWSNGLPGLPYDGDEPDGSWHRDELVAYFERYATEFGLPVQEDTIVRSVEGTRSGGFRVSAVGSEGAEQSIEARSVVVASGLMQSPKIPGVSSQFPASVKQLHAADFRSSNQLPDGSVVVVGGGQSGCQIAEDLIMAGRRVYVCTSRVARLPRRYRGKDILEWFADMGLWDVAVGDLPDPAMEFAAQPQVSGVGRYGSTLSLQHMQRQGVRLMGRLSGVTDGVMSTNDSLAEHIAYADDFSAEGKAGIDRYIEEHRVAAPPAIRIRASLHTGTAGVQLGDYYGSAVNRAARLRGIAHGGQTVMSGSTWELVQDQIPEGVTVKDMGEHGLKDLTRPEHVYQINIEGVPDDFPALKSLEAVPNNLPQQLTDFVGREKELADAKHLLADTRLLTILAPGGTGKTRLGIQAAADLISDYPDGVFFVGLADIGSSDEIIQSIAESLGLGLSSGEDPKIQLLAYLSNKQQLLVFDNFEHVADGAAIISDILKAAPAIRVIATSRSKLNLMGEAVLPLAGLQSSWENAHEAMQAGGVQLFLDAATRANPAFELAEDDLDALGGILRMTGGSPLCIILAAAWVDMLPVSEIASEVEKSLDFLETEMGDMPDRHRSVRAVFEYSWALLSEDESRMFAALSVFRGGFTREAAQAVAGASLRNVATLSNKSLVAPSPDTGRYAIHELLRGYAQNELDRDPERAASVREAHAEFYAEVMDEASALFFIADQPQMLSMVEQDLENIRSAWRYFIATRNGAGGSRLVFGLHFLYETRGWYRAGVDLFGEAADALGSDSEDGGIVVLSSMSSAVRGWFMALLGQPGVGAEAAAAALRSLPPTSELIHHWLALQSHALCLAYLGWTDDVAQLLEDGIVRYASDSNQMLSAGLRNWRSFASAVSGDFDTVRRHLPGAYVVLEQLDDHYFMTWNLRIQALMATGEGRPDDAVDLFARQVERAEAIGYRRGKVVALEGLGDAKVVAGRLPEAHSAFIEGIAVAEQMGMVRDLLGMMSKVGVTKASMGDDVDAVELLATVISEPISAQSLFTSNAPIREMADAALADLENKLGPDVYAAAVARGAARPYDVAAKELMDSLGG